MDLAELEIRAVDCSLVGGSCQSFDRVHLYGKGDSSEIAKLAAKLNSNCDVKCVDTDFEPILKI